MEELSIRNEEESTGKLRRIVEALRSIAYAVGQSSHQEGMSMFPSAAVLNNKKEPNNGTS